jgi:hypothetical protein
VPVSIENSRINSLTISENSMTSMASSIQPERAGDQGGPLGGSDVAGKRNARFPWQGRVRNSAGLVRWVVHWLRIVPEVGGLQDPRRPGKRIFVACPRRVCYAPAQR